jgi:cytidylate kinase
MVRAARRSREVGSQPYDAVAADLARRDAYDSGRRHAPLRTAEDAVVIDTSEQTVDEIVATVLDHWKQHDL